MSSRLSKQQLLDGLRNAGVEIPANASSSRLRELYDNSLARNNIKETEDLSGKSSAPIVLAGVSNEDSAVNTKTEARDSNHNSHEKTYDDAKTDVETKSDARQNTDSKTEADTKSDANGKESLSAMNTVITSVQTSASEAANLDLQLEILRKKHELLKLQHAIADLENGGPSRPEVTQVPTPYVTPNRLTFRDIEHAITKFDGENRAYGVYDFFRNFERVMNMVAADELFQYTSLCNSLTGTARLLLSRIDVISYSQLKAALVKEFGRAINRGEIYKILANHKWNKKDNIRRYVLEMENIASRCGDIDEFELIGFIIDGMQDNTPEAYLLMNARTLDQFKESLDLYEQRRATRPSVCRATVPMNKPVVAKKFTDANTTKPDTANIRCYNCTQMGHYQSKCPYDKRPDGSCFRCWKMGHDHRSCTNPKKLLTLRQGEVAAVSSEDAEVNDCFFENTIDAVNNVSIAFCDSRVKCKRFMNRFSLFDTGSPTSFIRRSYVPFSVNNTAKISKYRGLGKSNLMTFGTTEAKIKFRNRCEKIILNIVPDTTMSVPLILGREFLNKFNIHLYQKLNKKNISNKFNEFLDEGRSFFCALDQNKGIKTESQSAVNSDVENLIMNRDYPNHYQVFSEELKNNNGACKNLVSSSDEEKLCKGYELEPEFSLEDECVAGDYCNLEDFLLDISCININFSDIDIDPNLSQKHYVKLCDVITENYLEANDIEIKPYAYEMNIRLSSDIPFHFLPRRLSYYERKELQKITDRLLTNNIIRPSESPYSSPVVLVKKKNGELRKCVDYRALNKLTVRDNFPLPLIEDCIEYLGGKKYFTTLDLKNGFFHVKIASDSIKYTSFVTPYGQFEYLRMPFGLKNAPAVFQRYIYNIFRDLVDEGLIIIYMDDIIIATADFETHLKLISKVLRIIKERGLKLQLAKCKFGCSKIDYLGYCVSPEGIRPGDSHLAAIRLYPFPRSQAEMKTCLGLFSYFRKFVPNHARITKVLRQLTKDGKYAPTEECYNAFNTLKKIISSGPVLAIYEPKKQTELHCDASSSGFGAVLLQRQSDGRFHPVMFFSRATTAAEMRYHSFELETLAIIYALRRFKVYLQGIPFKIVTDCNSLTLTLGKKLLNPRIARWALELEDFNYTIQHRGGAGMGHVDALSRCLTAGTGDVADACVAAVEHRSKREKSELVAAIDSGEIDFYVQVAQNRDRKIVQLKQRLENEKVKDFEMRDGLVFRVGKEEILQLYVPYEMELNVIRLIHEKICHLGVEKTCNQLRKNYWFPKMQQKVTKYVRNCIQCIMFSAPARVNEHNLHSIPKKPVPFDTIHIDHFGPLPSINSKRKHILVIVDAFTKFVRLYPVISTSTKEVIACLDKYFSYYSRPRRIVSDRGTCFTSLDFSAYLLENNISHVKVATASPQANGQVERVNRVIKAMLGKITEPVSHANWSVMLSKIEYGLNNTVHSTTKESPSKLLFGVYQRGEEIDKLTEYLEDKQDKNVERSLNEIRLSSLDAIEKSQDYAQQHFQLRSKPAIKFREGDFVVIRNVNNEVGTNKKLIAKYRGPYIIHKVLPHDRYVVRDIENCQLTRLPYDGVIEASRIKKWLIDETAE